MIKKVHAPLNHPNRDICEFLMEVADYQLCCNNLYQYVAHRSAAQLLSNLPERVKIGQVKTLRGIGKKIGDKIEKFLQTGKHKGLEMIRKNDQKNKHNIIRILIKIPGIGPKRAKNLADIGIKTLEDLKKHQDKLSTRQRLELKYFEDFEKKIPREEVMKIEQLLTKNINELNYKYLVTICGNYRRGLDETNITAVVTHPDYISKVPTRNKKISMKMIVEWLIDRDLITDTISFGSKKFVGACRLPTCTKERFGRLSIHFVFYDQYYCAILYYTGSETFNKTIKGYALQQKYTLSKYMLKSVAEGVSGKTENITCEEDIFDILGLSYELPEWRNP